MEPQRLYVDLDGTLTPTDTLWESFLLLVKQRPLGAVAALWAVRRGKAALKHAVAVQVALDAAALPYREEVLAFVREKRSEGYSVILATAAHARVAEAVTVHHSGLFTAYLATDATRNLSGVAKRNVIVAHAGGAPFEYIGNGVVDVPVWEAAAVAHVVGSGVPMPEGVRVGERFLPDRVGVRNWMSLFRVHQWTKNILIFIPLLLAHAFDGQLVGASVVAFFALSLCASGVYLLNDVFDVSADRRDPLKRARLFARGAVPIPIGLLLAVGSFAVGLVLAGLVSAALLWMVAGYVLLTSLYTFGLKRVMVLDVILLAGFYTYRILVGSMATGIPVSAWLLAFSTFFFLSLALLKRLQELRRLEAHGIAAEASGRGYHHADLETLRVSGLNCGFLSAAILVLYLNSPEALLLYTQPLWLWGAVFVLIAWIIRLWVRASRQTRHTDPFLWILKDRMSYAAGAAIVLFVLLATFI